MPELQNPAKPPAIRKIATVFLIVATTAACGGTPAAQPAPAVTVVATVTAPASTPAAAPQEQEPPADTPAKAKTKATVPDVVGMTHQKAQDTLQAAGFFLIKEVDATGQGRLLVWDRNWVVVAQSPAGGASAAPETTVTLRSKKKDDP
ncbi:PASTA domain-containing protein [Sinosporangium siamense]|uniref:PASTA domain-containing protein n=1 Tax=Sinosporangium siamense TaxID=1367973 RepID=A0A919RB87_9ACTN|nr:PASTA domain-containing protein [Sinosporangium siamense]GII90756.1 hypothetical protein Ssi02_09870 [Sinosporangium siamense]